MTAVYKLGYDFTRVTAFALIEHVAGYYERFDGRSLAEGWCAPRVAPADTAEDDAMLGDVTVLGTVPLVSSRARTLLEHLGARAEFLPVEYFRAPLFIMNVLAVVDCLSAQSDCLRFPTGRVMDVRTYVFREDRLSDDPVFRIPELLRAHVFASEAFAAQAGRQRLTGCSFSRVWGTT